MSKQVINISDVKKSSTGFNHVVKAGDFIFLSSQLSTDLKTGEIIPGEIKQQTIKTMENIKYLLSHCHCSMDDIVKIVIYFRHPKDRSAINEVYKQYFTRGQEPAKISIQAASPIEGIDVEIEATAFTLHTS
ncbi:MAG: putative translation initiation inhibitor, yjgF family [Microgenomates group bacterium Gr01-1014_16]|nr:MAG: putative translation initiation inhibitor, yjgF family [Microgenomates group bacterium Gr01-1014_16]